MPESLQDVAHLKPDEVIFVSSDVVDCSDPVMVQRERENTGNIVLTPFEILFVLRKMELARSDSFVTTLPRGYDSVRYRIAHRDVKKLELCSREPYACYGDKKILLISSGGASMERHGKQLYFMHSNSSDAEITSVTLKYNLKL